MPGRYRQLIEAIQTLETQKDNLEVLENCDLDLAAPGAYKAQLDLVAAARMLVEDLLRANDLV